MLCYAILSINLCLCSQKFRKNINHKQKIINSIFNVRAHSRLHFNIFTGLFASVSLLLTTPVYRQYRTNKVVGKSLRAHKCLCHVTEERRRYKMPGSHYSIVEEE